MNRQELVKGIEELIIQIKEKDPSISNNQLSMLMANVEPIQSGAISAFNVVEFRDRMLFSTLEKLFRTLTHVNKQLQYPTIEGASNLTTDEIIMHLRALTTELEKRVILNDLPR